MQTYFPVFAFTFTFTVATCQEYIPYGVKERAKEKKKGNWIKFRLTQHSQIYLEINILGGMMLKIMKNAGAKMIQK